MGYVNMLKPYTSLANQAADVVSALGKRTIILLCISFVIILVSILSIDGWIRIFSQQTHEIIKYRNLVNNLNEIRFHVSNAESAQYGYMITERMIYLAPFESSIKIARANLAEIDFFLNNKHEIKKNSDELLKTTSLKFQSKLIEMQSTVKLVKLGKKESAINIINMDDGLHNMLALNQTIDQMLEFNRSIIDKKVKVRFDNTFYARCLVFISSLIWLTLVVMVLKQMLKEMWLKEGLKSQLKQEVNNCEKKLKDQNVLVRTMALDYQADVERERQRLSSELHDELGAIFTATKMDISWLMKKFKEPMSQLSPDAIIEKLQKTTQYINKGISFHRQVIEQLNPTGIATMGIWPALRSLITDAADRNNWKLTLDLPDNSIKLDETIALTTYRLVQETLNNANKYSKADAISVIIIMDENYIKVEIEDNGVGIDSTAQKSGTYGVSGMRNRIVGIGGGILKLLASLKRRSHSCSNSFKNYCCINLITKLCTSFHHSSYHLKLSNNFLP